MSDLYRYSIVRHIVRRHIIGNRNPGGMFSIPSECTSLQNASVHVRNMNIWQDICQGRAKGLGLGRGTPLHTPLASQVMHLNFTPQRPDVIFYI